MTATVPGLSLVWAQAAGGVIGADGGMPWHLPEDLARFKRLTTGSPVVMGRRTWDSLPASVRPLPGRRNVVLTRAAAAPDGAERLGSPAGVAALAADGPVWVIGGGELYRSVIDVAERIEVTEIDLDVPGDTTAPAIDPDRWAAAAGEWLRSEAGLRYRFVTYRRRAAGAAG